jgi:hypothetical protein
MGVKEDEAAKVNAVGDKIRQLKAAKAEKDVIMAEVEKLKAAKVAYEAAVGEPFPAPAPAPSKKKKQAPASSTAKTQEGQMSKNDQKKAARKAAAAAKKAEYAKGNIPPKQKSDGKKGGAAAPATTAPASASSVSGMDAAQVQAYLKSVSLEKYAKALSGVDGATLATMDDGALKGRGVAFAPHRRKLLKLVSGSGAGSSAALLAVALAGATVAANASPLLATVKSALAAVEQQIGSVDGTLTTPSQSRGQPAAGAAAANSVKSAPAPTGAQSQRPSAANAASTMDSALVAAAHRFYIAVGMCVEAQRTDSGSWEPAKVCGPPRDDLGCWQLKADGEGDWEASIHFTAIRPRRRFALKAAGPAESGESAAPQDWRGNLPAAKGVPRLQVLPGAKPTNSVGAPEVIALNADLDALEARIAKLEAKKKSSK